MNESEFTETILRQCIDQALATGQNAFEVAKDLAANILINLAANNDEDNILVMARKIQGQWRSHFHMDYLSAEHDHFKGDFAWDSPEPESQEDAT